MQDSFFLRWKKDSTLLEDKRHFTVTMCPWNMCFTAKITWTGKVQACTKIKWVTVKGNKYLSRINENIVWIHIFNGWIPKGLIWLHLLFSASSPGYTHGSTDIWFYTQLLSSNFKSNRAYCSAHRFQGTQIHTYCTHQVESLILWHWG